MTELVKTHVSKHSPSPVYGHTVNVLYMDISGQYWLSSMCPRKDCPGHTFIKVIREQVREWVRTGEFVPVKTQALAYLAS